MLSVVCTLFERIFGKLNKKVFFQFSWFSAVIGSEYQCTSKTLFHDSKNEEKKHTELYLSSILEAKQFVFKLRRIKFMRNSIFCEFSL